MIKQQATNYCLVGSWDNFQCRENVHGERLGDTSKFRCITMALSIYKSRRIPAANLKQSIWSPKQAMLCLRILIAKAFDKKNGGQQALCICHHRFTLFIAAFPSIQFLYSAAMPKVDIINCNTKRVTEVYSFAPSMSNESIIAGNIGLFEDLTI